MPITRAIALATLWIAAFSPVHSHAQGGEPGSLILGVVDVAPFSTQKADGSWEGLGIELWQAIAEELELDYEVREYRSLAELVEAMGAGEIDASPAIAASVRREVGMDLSHSYLQSGAAIAVPAAPAGPRWLGVAEQLVSLDFLGVIGLLFLLWLLAGAVVWLFERRSNPAMFPSTAVHGLGTGIWWAAVTMTTVGYGDKAPKTLGGRLVAIAWMLASIILISSFTAAITTSLTVDELSGKVRGLRDLPGVRVGSVAESEAMRFLGEYGVAPRPFASEEDGLRALVDGEIDALVFDKVILGHLAKAAFPGRVRVLPRSFDHYQVKLALPAGSPLREPLNRALLEIIESPDWSRRVERYLGPGH